MTDGNTHAIAQHLDEREDWDALQEVTVELEQAESDNILFIARIAELEAELATCEKYKAAYAECDRIGTQAVRELEAENKRLNEQMDVIEEMGTESLNALPDCLMRLAPALVENDELKAKLAKAVEALKVVVCAKGLTDPTEYGYEAITSARTTLAELMGDDDDE